MTATNNTPEISAPENSSPENSKQNSSPPKNRGGAPRGNSNARKHGMRSKHVFTLPKLGKADATVYWHANKLRAVLTEEVKKKHGKLSTYQKGMIATVVRLEVHGGLAARWLRSEGDKMTAADRLKFSKEIVRASEAKDRVLKRLGLGRDIEEGTEDPWASIYSDNDGDEDEGHDEDDIGSDGETDGEE